MRIANPRPGFCSCCFMSAPDRQYVDCEAAYDGAPVLDRETRTIAILPWTGLTGSHDDLYICDRCIREMRDVLGMEEYREVLKRQAREVRKLELERDHWRDTAKRLKEDLEHQLSSAFGPDQPRRGRVAA